jgi:DNA-binding XRE family transcriptional regulator
MTARGHSPHSKEPFWPPLGTQANEAQRERLAWQPDAWTAEDFGRARKLLGPTQVQLAERIGYTREGYGIVESGRGVLRPVVELAMRFLLLPSKAPVSRLPLAPVAYHEDARP